MSSKHMTRGALLVVAAALGAGCASGEPAAPQAPPGGTRLEQPCARASWAARAELEARGHDTSRIPRRTERIETEWVGTAQGDARRYQVVLEATGPGRCRFEVTRWVEGPESVRQERGAALERDIARRLRGPSTLEGAADPEPRLEREERPDE